MSNRGGEILWDLWSRVDQANYDLMIKEALIALPTKTQKKYIREIIENNHWDLDGEPADEDKESYKKFAGGQS